MRRAVPASVAIHLGLIAGAWMFMQWKPEDMSAAEAAVSIDIISTEEAVTDPSETVSEATASLVSAGTDVAVPETVEAEVADVAEPVEVVEPVEVAEAQPAQAVTAAAAGPVAEAVAPVETEALVSAAVLTAVTEVEAPVASPIPQVIDDAAPIVAEAVAPSEAPVLERLDQAAKLPALEPTPEIQQITTASIAPITPAEAVKVANLSPVIEAAEEPVEAPPVPKPRIVRKVEAAQPVEVPVETKKQAVEKPVEKPAKKQPKKVANLGNGGDADADSAASKAGGKAAKASSGGGNLDSYKGKVQSKLRRSLRYPRGARGDGVVMVQFVISGSGSASGIRVTGSSGNGDLDDAAIATVKRAAPFPPIPPELGQSSVTIVMPLQFNG